MRLLGITPRKRIPAHSLESGRPPGVPAGRGSSGPECPQCGECRSAVVDSRKSDGAVRRRRICCSCEQRFTTYETVTPDKIIDYQI